MPRLRIISPRWNADLNRHQMPGEVVEVSDEEAPHWAPHTVLVVPEPSSPAPSPVAPAPRGRGRSRRKE